MIPKPWGQGPPQTDLTWSQAGGQTFVKKCSSDSATPVSTELPTPPPTQACTFAQDDTKTLGPHGFVVGTRGCAGHWECQFKSIKAAEDFCESETSCTGILLHPDPIGVEYCAMGLGCFTPRQGPPQTDLTWSQAGGQTFVKKCSSDSATPVSTDLPTPPPTQAPTPAPTPAPRPAPTPMPTPAGDVHLSAYWDSGACGPLGDDYQWDWCGKRAFSCQDTVSTDRCPSGVAELEYKKGTGTCCSSVNINGCDYAYFAQYKCKEESPAPMPVSTELPTMPPTKCAPDQHECPGLPFPDGSVGPSICTPTGMECLPPMPVSTELPAPTSVPTPPPTQACTFAQDDTKTLGPHGFVVGTRGCAGHWECQFKSIKAAEASFYIQIQSEWSIALWAWDASHHGRVLLK